MSNIGSADIELDIDDTSEMLSSVTPDIAFLKQREVQIAKQIQSEFEVGLGDKFSIQNSLTRLMVECPGIFSSESEAYSFLMD